MQAEAVQILPEGVKARRVYLSVRDQITAGDLRDGETLPGEQKLAEAFGVSRVTVRRALEALAQGGLIERRAGSGTRVRARSASGQRAAINFNTLMPQLVEMGQKTTARLLSFSYGGAPDFVSSAMGFERDTKVQIATRVRLAANIPFSHLTTYVPAQIAQSYSENDLATTPLFQLLERSGVKIKEAHQSVSATLAGPEVAEALGVEVGSALLSLRRVVRDLNGSGVEYLTGLYRPDMFRLEMPLTRVGQGSARHWEPAIGQDEGGA
ncbi:GntR family transcriptional regulator [Planktomarina sp.]|uniref:GntR family transcriptional regulator n=1 Tax=Planktomarina sp. TaxID=2024851 RepID=UPI00288C9199|nr:GntR family transcriptional regulator [Planktomarina sp.]MDT2031510.1 GntR family transcriptional regulator [Planktomarina sp.]MDT2070839.1 GntR family transcriptional regulator [Planktomarina sp.]